MRNVYSSDVFAGVDLFALKFYLVGVVPSNHSWRQKTRDTGLRDAEDYIPLRSLVLTQYRSVTDGQTDRRTDLRSTVKKRQFFYIYTVSQKSSHL